MAQFYDYWSELVDLCTLPDDFSPLDFDYSDCLLEFCKPPLTLKELYKIYHSKGYASERGRKGMQLVSENGKTFVQKKPKWYSPNNASLLYRHIIAEQLLVNDCSKINFQEEQYDNPFILIELIRLWLNPLMSEKPTKLEKVVVNGTSAVEKYFEARLDSVKEIYNYISLHFLLDFADNPKVCKENDKNGAFCSIHDWSVIARGESLYIQNTYDGCNYSMTALQKMDPYDAFDLRDNLIRIAKHRGGKRAAELLRMLQTEWPTIKTYKIQLKQMSDDDIAAFESAIYYGCADLLRTWDEQSSSTTPDITPSSTKQQHHQIPPAHGPMYFSNCTFKDCNNTTNIGTQNNYASPTSPGESSESSTSKRGRKVKPLFIDEKGLEDLQRTEEERNRFLNYLKDHDLSQRLLDSSKENLIHKAIVCFCKKWKQLRYIKGDISASAVFRFLTVTCELHCDTVEERGISNVLAQMLKSDCDESIYYDVKDYF